MLEIELRFGVLILEIEVKSSRRSRLDFITLGYLKIDELIVHDQAHPKTNQSRIHIAKH